jgi:hypothetical protein
LVKEILILKLIYVVSTGISQGFPRGSELASIPLNSNDYTGTKLFVLTPYMLALDAFEKLTLKINL